MWVLGLGVWWVRVGVDGCLICLPCKSPSLRLCWLRQGVSHGWRLELAEPV